MKPACAHLCMHFQSAMNVLSKPWTGLIVATLEQGALRFSEIGERIPSIGDRILSSRLKELEAEGVVLRRVDPGPPVRVTYELTEAGMGFGAAADAISAWGAALAKQKASLGGRARAPRKAARPASR